MSPRELRVYLKMVAAEVTRRTVARACQEIRLVTSAATGSVLRVILLATLLGLVAGPTATYGQKTPRPNILWIIADDHVPYVMGAYGNKQVRTPNLAKLASQGMRFDRAFCNSPVCTASRQSFLTGRYPRTIGVTQLQSALPENELTLSEIQGQRLRHRGHRQDALQQQSQTRFRLAS